MYTLPRFGRCDPLQQNAGRQQIPPNNVCTYWSKYFRFVKRPAGIICGFFGCLSYLPTSCWPAGNCRRSFRAPRQPGIPARLSALNASGAECAKKRAVMPLPWDGCVESDACHLHENYTPVGNACSPVRVPDRASVAADVPGVA